MKYITIIFIIFLSLSCEKHPNCYMSDKQISVNKVRKKAALQIKKELGLIPFGTGGQMLDEIKMLYLAFQCHEYLGIEKSRELLISSVSKFLSEINSNEEIRPYLISYPFEAKNVQIEIFIQNLDGSSPSPENLCIVSAQDGILEYLSKNPNGPLFKTVHSETYEEALKRLNR